MRVVKSFNDSWYFSKSDVFPVEISKDFEEVVLPHTWNALDGQDGGNDYHRGTCHYVKKFTKDELPVNDEYYLEIEGANASADVFLNGKKLAHHDGGYSTFRVNLTEALEEDNTLVIAVDNSINDVVYPQMADFTFYGGLYRDVNLICVNKSHFDLDYYGGPGIKVTPTLNDDNKTLIEVEVYGNFEEEVTYKLFDKEGNELLSKVDNTAFSSTDIENLYSFDYQLEKGDTATAYSPYQNLNRNISDTGWIDMSSCVNTTNVTIRSGFTPMVRKIGNIVYWQGEVYCTTAPGSKNMTILQNIPSEFRPINQFSTSGVPYQSSSPYNMFIDKWGVIKVSMGSNIPTTTEYYGFQLNNINGYLSN